MLSGRCFGNGFNITLGIDSTVCSAATKWPCDPVTIWARM